MKICPNCQKENLDTARFCVYCGFDIANVAVTTNQAASQTSEQPDYAKASTDGGAEKQQQANTSQTNTGPSATSQYHTNYAANNGFSLFMRYIKESLINPRNDLQAPKYGGLMAAGLYIIISLIMFGFTAKRVGDLAADNQVAGAIISPITSNMMGFAGILILIMAIYLLVTFAVRRLILNDNIAFLDFTDTFGVYVNLSSILLLASFVFSLFISTTSSGFLPALVMSLFVLSIGMLSYASMMTLVDVHGKFNTFYAILIAQLISGFLIGLVTENYISGIIENFENLISQFSGY